MSLHFFRKQGNPGTSLSTRPIDIGILLCSIPSSCILSLGSKAILDEDTMQALASGELGPRLRDMYLLDEYIPYDPEWILTMRRELDIGMGNDHRGRSSSGRYSLRGIFLLCGSGWWKIGWIQRRIHNLAQDGVSVPFDFVRIEYWADIIWREIIWNANMTPEEMKYFFIGHVWLAVRPIFVRSC